MKPNDPKAGPPGPEALLQLQFAMAPARILATGVQLSVFTHIAQGTTSADKIAKAASANERAMRMLLDALTAFQLLSKKGSTYGLSPLAADFLVEGKPDYMGEFLGSDRMWESWTSLDKVVRTGKPLHKVEAKEAAEQFFPVLVKSLHVMNRDAARRTAEALVAGRKGLRVIDVACGSGVWGIAVAEADRDARVTAQDFPVVLETTKVYLERHKVTPRFDFLPGDLKEVDYGKDRYDVALLGNIVHSEGEKSSRALFGKLAKALRPGGKIAVIDMIPNDERTGPPFPLIFALNMLLHTELGDCYTLDEYTRWLREAGFGKVDTVDIGSHSPLIVGTKA